MIQRLIISVLLSSTVAASCGADELDDAVRAAILRVSPSMVRVQILGAADRAGNVVSRVTTGVAISDDGEIVSSSFGFSGDSTSVFVQTVSGERLAATVVATDHVRKLVLLKTDAEGLTPPEWLPDLPAVGAWSIAAGRFYATRTPSAARGIISALNRVNGLAIQTDAKVSPVNYGGPLVTMDGRVSGILVPLSPGNDTTGVSAGVGWYDSGIGFAIPAADVADSVRHLRGGQDRHHGIAGIVLTEEHPLSTDVIVKSVQPQSPAAASGLQIGDRIIAANGQPVSRLGILQSVLRSSWAGDVVALTVRREAAEQTLDVTLTDEIPAPERGWLGVLPGVPATSDDQEQQGALAAVLSGSPASDAGLPGQCLISQVDGEDTGSTGQLRQALGGLTAGRTINISFRPADGSMDVQTVSVTARPWPEEQLSNLMAQVAALRQADASTGLEWTQSVTDLKEERHVWFLGPEQPIEDSESGLVILLHDGKPVTDALIQDWRDTCRQQQLILAVVYHEYSLPLDAVATLAEVTKAAARFGTLDPDRLVLITGESHASFVLRQLLNPRITPLRQAVFMDCRPIHGGTSLRGFQRKHVSILIYPPDSSAQEDALILSSVRKMRAAGAAVTVRRESTDSDNAERADEIARWMLLQKIR